MVLNFWPNLRLAVLIAVVLIKKKRVVVLAEGRLSKWVVFVSVPNGGETTGPPSLFK